MRREKFFYTVNNKLIALCKSTLSATCVQIFLIAIYRQLIEPSSDKIIVAFVNFVTELRTSTKWYHKPIFFVRIIQNLTKKLLNGSPTGYAPAS